MMMLIACLPDRPGLEVQRLMLSSFMAVTVSSKYQLEMYLRLLDAKHRQQATGALRKHHRLDPLVVDEVSVQWM
jgi:hypothetical protein